MKPVIHSRRINGPFDDPGIYISFQFEKRAILFDCGDLNPLSPKEILKVDYVFISHTHMDHFSGFDNLLRLFLGREKELLIFGPKGFLTNIEGKFAAYSWNLVNNFKYPFSITAVEVHPHELKSKTYHCSRAFLNPDPPVVSGFSGVLANEPAFSVSAAVLDHKIPCLAFSLKEKFHVNILKDRLQELDLTVGPWIKTFKQALYDGADPDSDFSLQDPSGETKTFRIGTLAEQIAMITEGQKITYITDAAYHDANIKKMAELAQSSDRLYIEASFLDEDRETAREKHHLTARQAGLIAGMAQVKQFTLFHFSPRYMGREDRFQEESAQAYEMAAQSLSGRPG